MVHNMFQQAADTAMAMGPVVLIQGMQLRRPIDVVGAHSLSIDDKRAILASWASDFYAVDSKPALRQIPGGQRLRARSFRAQQTEAAIGISILNRMLACGRPRSVRCQASTAATK